MLGLNRKKVKLSKYNSAWAEAFKIEKAAIEKKLGDEVLEIQHIGSTAIPGMSAKPILDFMVAVKNVNDFEKYIKPLRQLGYEFRRDNRDEQEHILFVKGPEDKRTHYLKLTQTDSIFWEEHILFRDYLINNPKVAAEYEALKIKLMKENKDNREMYTQLKSDFIQKIIYKAKRDKKTAA